MKFGLAPSVKIASWLLLVVAALFAADALAGLILGPFPFPIRAWRLSDRRAQEALACAGIALSLGLLARGAGRRPWTLVVGALTVATLAVNGRTLNSGDTVSSAVLNFCVIREHTFALDSARSLVGDGSNLPYAVQKHAGHYYSRYPVATPLLALPFYLPSALGWFDPNTPALEDIEKIAAAFLTAIGAALLFGILRGLVGLRAALVAITIYVLGTSTLSILGQALWQHTGAGISLSLALWGFFRVRAPISRGLVVGIGTGLLVACRPIDVLLAAPVLLALLLENRRAAVVAGFTALVPLLLMGVYNQHVFGSPFATGYGDEASKGWSSPFWTGLSGLLVSPARGILVSSPVLFAAFIALARPSSSMEHRRSLRIIAAGSLAFVLVMSKWWCWWGGWSPGPRMLSDCLPIWGIGIGLAVAWGLRSRWRVLGVSALAAASIASHTCLVYPYLLNPWRAVAWQGPGESPWDAKGYPPFSYLYSKKWLTD